MPGISVLKGCPDFKWHIACSLPEKIGHFKACVSVNQVFSLNNVHCSLTFVLFHGLEPWLSIGHPSLDVGGCSGWLPPLEEHHCHCQPGPHMQVPAVEEKDLFACPLLSSSLQDALLAVSGVFLPIVPDLCRRKTRHGKKLPYNCFLQYLLAQLELHRRSTLLY